MSGKALGWAREQVCSGGLAAKAVLLLMGDYATGDVHELHPSIGTMARELQTTDRTVQRAMKTLEADGLVERELRATARGKSTSSRYRLKVGEPRHSDTPSPDTLSPPGVTECHPDPDTVSPSTTFDPDLPDPRMGEGRAREGFGQTLTAWLGASQNSRTNPEAAAAAWDGVVGAGVDPERLAAAAMAALADDPDFKRRGPPGLQRWLAEKRYIGWLDRPASAAQPKTFPDVDLRAAMVFDKGEAWTASWLDPCRWSEPQRTIVARTGFAAETLRRDVGQLLAAHGVRVTEPAEVG